MKHSDCDIKKVGIFVNSGTLFGNPDAIIFSWKNITSETVTWVGSWSSIKPST